VRLVEKISSLIYPTTVAAMAFLARDGNLLGMGILPVLLAVAGNDWSRISPSRPGPASSNFRAALVSAAGAGPTASQNA
jgi:hypothetical protein